MAELHTKKNEIIEAWEELSKKGYFVLIGAGILITSSIFVCRFIQKQFNRSPSKIA